MTLNGSKTTISQTDVIVVRYPHAMMSAVLGLQEIMQMANYVEAEREGINRFNPRAVDYDDIAVTKPTDNTGADRTIVVLPPSFQGDFYMTPHAGLSEWLQGYHKAGATLCSACAGAFMLADAGLLENRVATTHWGLAQPFAMKFPGVQLNIDKIVINGGDIITAGGLMSWIDLGLEIIATVMGPAVMREVGHRMVMDTAPREQRYYKRFQPVMTHGDAAVLKAQHHIHEHYDDPLKIRDLATISILGERTFLRRFTKGTGLKPLQYLQRLRIQHACDLLEESTETVESIAIKVGYEDASAFRKTFSNLIGLTPKEFRTRFAPR